MPEEKTHLDDYGDGAEPKSSLRKFFAAFVVIIVLVVAAFAVLRFISR